MAIATVNGNPDGTLTVTANSIPRNISKVVLSNGDTPSEVKRKIRMALADAMRLTGLSHDAVGRREILELMNNPLAIGNLVPRVAREAKITLGHEEKTTEKPGEQKAKKGKAEAKPEAKKLTATPRRAEALDAAAVAKMAARGQIDELYRGKQELAKLKGAPDIVTDFLKTKEAGSFVSNKMRDRDLSQPDRQTYAVIFDLFSADKPRLKPSDESAIVKVVGDYLKEKTKENSAYQQEMQQLAKLESWNGQAWLILGIALYKRRFDEKTGDEKKGIGPWTVPPEIAENKKPDAVRKNAEPTARNVTAPAKQETVVGGTPQQIFDGIRGKNIVSISPTMDEKSAAGIFDRLFNDLIQPNERFKAYPAGPLSFLKNPDFFRLTDTTPQSMRLNVARAVHDFVEYEAARNPQLKTELAKLGTRQPDIRTMITEWSVFNKYVQQERKPMAH